MFGLGKNDDEERFFNFVLFNFYGTDEEASKAAPWLAVIFIIAIIVSIAVAIWG